MIADGETEACDRRDTILSWRGEAGTLRDQSSCHLSIVKSMNFKVKELEFKSLFYHSLIS